MPCWDVTTPPRNTTLLTKQVPLTIGGPYKFTVAARMTLGLQAGTVVLFWSKIQAADELPYGLMYAGYLRYRYGASVVQISTAQGINILDRKDHYGIDHQLAMFTAPSGGTYTVEHIIYAGSTAYDPADAATDYLQLRYCHQQPLLLTPAEDPRIAEMAGQIAALQQQMAALQPPPAA
jgi:hypothetical protein